MTAALTWLAVGLAAVGTGALLTLAGRRFLLAQRERLRTAAERRLTPLALALLAGEQAEPPALERRDLHVLAALLARFSQRVTGAERTRIARFFEHYGGLDRELAELGAARGWRRAAAAFALGDMASPRAVPKLLVALDDASAAVRWAAARSLGRLGAASAVEPLVYAFAAKRVPRARAGQALLEIGVAALPALRELTQAPDAGARQFAAELLGYLGSPGDSARLVERLRDSSAEVRAQAARALGRLAAADAASAVQAVLEDRISFVRAAAAHALAAVGDPAAAAPLLRVAAEDDFDAARAAAAAAAKLAPAAVAQAALAAHSSPHVREAADLLSLTP